MPNQPLNLFRIGSLDQGSSQRRIPPLAGSLSRRRLRRLLAMACANDVPDETQTAVLLDLHERLRSGYLN